MYGLSLRIIIACAFLGGAFATGWKINGDRWEAKHSKELFQLSERVKAVNNTIETSYIVERNKKDEEIRNLTNKLNVALSGLRDRPSRITASITGDGKATSGAYLFREDAEFLTREASRADHVVVELKACYARYDEVRTALSK